MSPLKLNGSTSGFVALDAPAAAGSNTLVLPTGNGSNGQVLTTNGSGTLSWSTVTSSQWTTTGSDIYYTTGKVLVGTSTNLGSAEGYEPRFQVAGSTQGLSVGRYQASNPYGAQLYLQRSKSDTIGGHAVMASGDEVGYISFEGSDGTAFKRAAAITALVDGTPGTNDMPGRLVFATTADGATSPTERMRISQNGSVAINKTTTAIGTAGLSVGVNDVGSTKAGALIVTVDGEDCIYINRLTSDGNLISFRQDGTQEGTISVSGTTVSYNGAHLSRYSQLPSGAEREEILRGTVLSNIDEMCEWGDEENEQLNRMKVSDVEGDKNVSGVFQAWDDDDDTYVNDFYCAMTGDFIIRIAADVTVERGDLLMSAGDGTAKPQDDDIIRSKTIAKVTSTHVTCTYDDGSYCVPCVLMAC